MQKFYVHRTGLAYVTEVVEIEAVDEAAAKRAVVFDGQGQSIGVAVGDYYTGGGPDETVAAFPAYPHNLPALFLPFGTAIKNDAENTRFPISDWRYEVSNGDTKLGYAEWLDKNLEQERFGESRYEQAARAAGWTRIMAQDDHDEAFLLQVEGKDDRVEEYGSWQELCEIEGISLA